LTPKYLLPFVKDPHQMSRLKLFFSTPASRSIFLSWTGSLIAAFKSTGGVSVGASSSMGLELVMPVTGIAVLLIPNSPLQFPFFSSHSGLVPFFISSASDTPSESVSAR